MLDVIKMGALFAVTALAEIVGCYLPWLMLKQGRSAWLQLSAAPSFIPTLQRPMQLSCK